jgi:lipopolysaccharide transport system ATP-binding protein
MKELVSDPTRAPVIEVNNVSMAYRLYSKPIDLLKEALFGGVHHDTFWAVRDVSLEVFEGERVGIIGPNGAGKSTLLQIITGNLKPAAGQVRVIGRISSLLSMVPAWNSEETGIQNIKFNLFMQGTPERQIPRLIEEIVEFTELGAFIYHPVKTYSTGMSTRLSFAIATATEPDILIIDEVLGAGDGYFAAKAHRRMLEFCARGRALLFVSHALPAVRQMCSRVMWMQNGSVRLQGEADYVLKQYELDYRKAEDEDMVSKQLVGGQSRGSSVSPDEILDTDRVRFRIVADQTIYFSATHFVRSIRISGLGGKPIDVPLEFTDLSDAKEAAALDLLDTEWGRIHERGDSVTRVLTRATGRRLGGQFIVRIPPELTTSSPEVQIEIDSSTTDERENIAVEVLDMDKGCWRPLKCIGRDSLGGGWSGARFAGFIAVVRPEKAIAISEQIIERTKADVEILEVFVTVNGERAVLVSERQPFAVCVRVLFRQTPSVADVGIKFSRADGVYVFWQSSGLSGANLVRPSGEKIIKFHFDPNEFGQGEYFVNSHVSNGWRYPENYPYSQVFARVPNAASFRIVPEMRDLDFGVLNIRARVEVSSSEVAAPNLSHEQTPEPVK